jgi:hypothetical protein
MQLVEETRKGYGRLGKEISSERFIQDYKEDIGE